MRIQKNDKAKFAYWLHRLEGHFCARNLPRHRLPTFAELLTRLDLATESGDEWSARCPAHPDTQPSLSVGIAPDGKFLVTCHRGCKFEAIVEAAGMTTAEMFDTALSVHAAVLPPRRSSNLVPAPTVADPNWAERQALFQRQATAPRIRQLASQLAVSPKSLRSIGIGWCVSDGCWTFPEYNGLQQICGIVRRFPSGDKRSMRGGHRGLTLPRDWQEGGGPLHICEGQSDVAAALSADMRAIGRPGIQGGFRDLVALLKAEKSELIVVADNDAEGQGREGAKELAIRLSRSLRRKVDVKAPPARFKDLREFLTKATK